MKLSASSPVLISLIHLSDNEIKTLTSEIGFDPLLEPVQIYNWPKDAVPASRVDMWRIFDQVKPEFLAPYEQVFGFFIDCTDMHSMDRKPEIIVVDRRRQSSTNAAHENIMRLFKIQSEDMLFLWKGAWNPTGRGTHNGCRENESINRKMWTFEVVGNPDVPTIVGDPYPVFLLGPISEYQIRAVRAALMQEEGEYQFITVPNGDGTLEGLVRYFESPEFRHYEEPPHFFIAVDEETLDALPDPQEDDAEKWKPGDCSVILASASGCTASSPSYSVREYLGYGYGRTSLGGYGPHSAMNNLSTGNMDLFELIEPDDDGEEDEYGQCKPKKVFWSTFTPGDAVLDY
ncbi:uncharacterized protein BDZ99DRAFT_468446 [Mytilinidion resinicola]|uniref:Uncharacterized protein n=1 Tax=Mytilinidion resinicola TaxID=574789 RepID=A0A6A6Y358_9PEZI|nr:uncharacterized protein BDZ99DRAFT_468446 [Mytilinidion resinicola]KAF2803100.1 hypothetical protein BDZ99DRAFT_468446 [Mytilinidion resinicola]